MAGSAPTTYQELLRIELQHDYFLDGQLPDLAITATRATTERLRRAGIVLRQQPSGCTLLWVGTRPIAPTLQSALGKRIFPLLFALQPRTPNFQIYTELPTGQIDPVPTYFFSPPPPAAVAGPAASAASAAAIQYLSVPSPTLLGLRPLAFDYYRPHPSALADAPGVGTAGLYAQGERLAAWLLSAPGTLPTPGLPLSLSPTVAAVDVSRWGSGRYLLRVGTATATDALDFYADDDLYATRAWGVLAIGPDALAAQSLPVYQLSFSARAVYWHYQVQLLKDNRLMPTPPELEIKATKSTGKTTADFEEWPSTPLGVSRSFRSKDKINLRNLYTSIQNDIFTLHSAPQETAPPIRKQLSTLPQAELQHLKTEKEGPVAEIFVRIRL